MAVIIKIFKWVFIICLFITLISFTSVSFNKDEFSISKIHIDSISQNFITEDILRKYLKDDFSFNSDSTSFDLQLIELALNDNPYINNNQVFYELSNGVSLNIKTRNPLLRILTNDTTYYITDDCSLMPFSSDFTSRSLVASGNIRFTQQSSLCELSKYINSNEFLKSLIGQIYIDYNSEIILIPRIGNNEILFGNFNNIDIKFNKLLMFYTKIIPKKGWQFYSKINLAFEDQIICSKN